MRDDKRRFAFAAMALLWFFVFPWAEPLLPFDDVQVSRAALARRRLRQPAS